MQAEIRSSSAARDSQEVTSMSGKLIQSNRTAASAEVCGAPHLASDDVYDNQKLNNLLMALLLYPGCWQVPR
jgi:hypothetical protein